jgi:ADP-dependent NAD(P)H-hydrate dehydratase / NAD(P)H-hydrate epimerase
LAGKQDSRRAAHSALQPLTEEWAAATLPRRTPGAHKWGVGGVVVVAGSPLYAGAAALCCAAAGRSGAGIVSAALPRSIAGTVVGLVPEVTVVVLPEGESVSVALRGADATGERLQRSKAMIVGPGLGTDEAASSLLSALFGFTRARSGIGFGAGGGESGGVASRGVIADAGKPVVVDADALNWLAEQASWWEKVPRGLLVLTPHPGEMARLTGQESEAILNDPIGVALEAAQRWGQTVVLKGGQTVVASPDGTARGVEATPALATAGSGDVLSGSLGALLAQGLDVADAAALAVYVGCRAAEATAAELGTLGVVAGDLPMAIAKVLRDLESRSG